MVHHGSCFVGDGVSLEFVGFTPEAVWKLVFWEWQLLFLGFLFERKTGWAASILTGTGTSSIVRIKSIDGLNDVVPRYTHCLRWRRAHDGELRHGLLFLAVRHGVRSETKLSADKKRNGIGDSKIEDGFKNRRMAEIKYFNSGRRYNQATTPRCRRGIYG